MASTHVASSHASHCSPMSILGNSSSFEWPDEGRNPTGDEGGHPMRETIRRNQAQSDDEVIDEPERRCLVLRRCLPPLDPRAVLHAALPRAVVGAPLRCRHSSSPSSPNHLGSAYDGGTTTRPEVRTPSGARHGASGARHGALVGCGGSADRSVALKTAPEQPLLRERSAAAAGAAAPPSAVAPSRAPDTAPSEGVGAVSGATHPAAIA